MKISDFEHHYRVSARIAPHNHSKYEIHLITAGEGWMALNDHKYPVGIGNLFVISPEESHGLITNLRKGVMAQYIITASTADDDLIFKETIRRYYTVSNCPQVGIDIIQKFENLQYDWKQNSDLLNASVEYRLKGLLYQLAAKRPRQIFCDNRLAAVTGYMKENIQKKITLAELANVASLEKSYFNRWFRQFTGKSPLKFFMQMKLQVAKELLNENMSNSYIATTLSFADEFHFCRSFKQQFGITPKAFARNNHLTSI